jgi:hypothetical protein
MWPVDEQDGRVRVSPPRESERVPQVPRWGRFPQGWYKLAYCHELDEVSTLTLERFGRTCRVERVQGVSRAWLDEQVMPTVEVSGHVLGWYGGGTPQWAPPPLGGLMGDRRVWMSFSEEVGSSLWDVAENPFDSAHLHTIHSLKLRDQPEIVEEGCALHQTFDADYAPPLLDRLRPAFVMRTRTDLRAWGLGLTLTRIETPLLVPVTIIGSNTPVREGCTEYNLVFISDPAPAHMRILFRLIARRIWSETLPERQIWSAKRYTPHPYVAGGERTLAVFRRWAQQFPEC